MHRLGTEKRLVDPQIENSLELAAAGRRVVSWALFDEHGHRGLKFPAEITVRFGAERTRQIGIQNYPIARSRSSSAIQGKTERIGIGIKNRGSLQRLRLVFAHNRNGLERVVREQGCINCRIELHAYSANFFGSYRCL